MDHPNNSDRQCRIAVDAMGGDFAPTTAVLGALQAYDQSKDFELLLVGNKDEILKIASSNQFSIKEEMIVHTDEVIEMGDSPTLSIKNKPKSSLVIGAKLVKDKKADGFVSAGNTGAMTVSSIINIGRIKGVVRPTLTAPFPNEKDEFTFISDVGAFVDSKPLHLFGYAILSSIFIEEIYGIKNPKIGLLNVGEEEGKGFQLTSETGKLLSDSRLNYFGNVEGKDIFKGTVDLVVCDGFIGNILLKFAESIIPFLKARIKNYASLGILNKLRALMVRTPLREALKSTNYELHGGLPLLGVDGISIIGHGSSSQLAIKNMVLRAKEMHHKNLIKKIEVAINQYSIN
ncbi:MAG: phosphate acyltransferase PlsX [Ignavibacteria bacterium]|nr:MAG: phosphate acyltransferase PlsX [Ignavibacteria bacterium]